MHIFVSQANTLFIYHTHYDPFTSSEWFLKFEFFEIIFLICKNFKYHNFKIMSAFHMWKVGCHHFKKNLIKKNLLKKSLT
jgi:hypothetical protein